MENEPGRYENPQLQRFYDYWLGKCRDGRPPARADIDPVDIHDMLPGIMIIDVVEDEGRRRFRFRLFGTSHVEFNQRDLTGKFIDEVFTPEDSARVDAAYAELVRRGAEPLTPPTTRPWGQRTA